jgi:nucleotide-binding universal stress UspA family protein
MSVARRLLLATDFSRASAGAFRAAVEWARRERAELVVAHVVEPLVIEPTFLSAEERRDFARFADWQAEQALRPLMARARRAGVRVTTVTLHGRPFEEIVREARRQRVRLAVVGTHGRSGLARVVLGSVAERVIALAPCPVLTVNG